MAIGGIIPKRLGLKYSPVPTLALEYEDEIEDKIKVAVVELPELQMGSVPANLVARIQKENQLFAPSLVNEEQLCRLMQHLIDHHQPHFDIPTPVKINDSKKNCDLDNSPQVVEVDHSSDEEELEGENEEPPPQSELTTKKIDTEETPSQSHETNKTTSEEKNEQVKKTETKLEREEDHESEFEESFDEESFIEESTEVEKPSSGSFLTQPIGSSSPTNDHESDEEAESSRGKFGTSTSNTRIDSTQITPSDISSKGNTPTEISTPIDPPKSSQVDESMEDIPSEEELDYFSGGDESGDDDGF